VRPSTHSTGARAADASLLTRMIAQMPNAVSLVSATEGTILYTNETWDRMFGYAPNEAVGRHLSNVSMMSDEALPGERLREVIRAMARHGSWTGDVQQLRKDGVAFWCTETIWQFDDEQGDPIWAAVYGEPSFSR
jgi:PAS domain S-box-containing protein